jgi:hypothetical protein
MMTSSKSVSIRRGCPVAEITWIACIAQKSLEIYERCWLIVGTQYRDRSRLQRVFGQAPENPPGYACTRRVEHKFPVPILHAGTEAEQDAFVVCI